MESPRCEFEDHELKELQLAVPGDAYHPEKSILGIKTIAGPTMISCSHCAEKITQGWYYGTLYHIDSVWLTDMTVDCWDCRQSEKPMPWTICLSCYTNGRTCQGDETHRLYAFPRTIFATFSADTPYQRTTDPQTGRATCRDCGALVEKGAYFRESFELLPSLLLRLINMIDCSKCDDGKYDLCQSCYQTGKHCRRNDHVLTKYYAWKYKRNIDMGPSSKKLWKCSNPECLDITRRNNFYFSKLLTKHHMLRLTSTSGCLERSCMAKQFGLCAPCYFSDLCCPVKEHDIFKCILR
jgi:hypothetical protein